MRQIRFYKITAEEARGDNLFATALTLTVATMVHENQHCLIGMPTAIDAVIDTGIRRVQLKQVLSDAITRAGGIVNNPRTSDYNPHAWYPILRSVLAIKTHPDRSSPFNNAQLLKILNAMGATTCIVIGQSSNSNVAQTMSAYVSKSMDFSDLEKAMLTAALEGISSASEDLTVQQLEQVLTGAIEQFRAIKETPPANPRGLGTSPMPLHGRPLTNDMAS